MALYVGDDWSEDHHDVQLMNEAGEQLAARRLPEGVKGVATLHELIAQHTSDPGEVAGAAVARSRATRAGSCSTT